MNDITCTPEALAPSILIENHQVIDTQEVIQPNNNQNNNIETVVDNINTLPSEKKIHSSELWIIYVVLVLLVAFTLYQNLEYRRMMLKLNELKKLNESSSKPKGTTDMNPISPTTKTSHCSSLPPSETINPDNSILDDHKSREPLDKSVNVSIKEPESKSIATPQKTQKEEKAEEVKEDKFSYEKRINFRHEMERINRQIKREHEENRDHFASFAQTNLELKAGLETIVVAMSKFTYSLVGQEREICESHVKNLNTLLRQWKNTLEDYDVMEILPMVGEDYRKYEKLCTIDKESIDTDDPQKNETIAKVLEKGYRLESRVLHRARVCIHKYRPV